MTPERYHRVRALFDALLEQPAAARADVLRQACAGDTLIEAEVTKLFAADAAAGTFLESPEGKTGFAGTERFQVLRQLGAGGYGVVYQVLDRRDRSIVALKTLPYADAVTIGRFKREFRALADVAHPNLVILYELISEVQHWFFTMEFVDGIDFQRHASEALKKDWRSLRAALHQLARGICAVHQAGKLHCDLKPHNVLVDRDGRVVILDFGLAVELGLDRETGGGIPVGTPEYMAPEQAVGLNLSPAADWYSFGVMLYEALTGRLPIDGTIRFMVEEKQKRIPPPPSALAREIPDDLDELCRELLCIDPALRPTGDDIIRRLEVTRSEFGMTVAPRAPTRLAGRDGELHTLFEALRSAETGRSTAVLVHGLSGAGKSSLLNHFAESIRRQDRCLVLKGRCYERESVPFKALDGIVDSLNQYLRTLPPKELTQTLPKEIGLLLRLFPVFRQVEMLAPASFQSIEIPEPKELRLRAFKVLVELLTAVARQKPVVLLIDDLHWGDVDSAPLLQDLLRPSSSIRLLFVACYRSEEAETNPLLQKLLPIQASDRESGRVKELSIADLDEAAARELALTLLDGEGIDSQSRAEEIARESGGNPFFIGELVQYSQRHRLQDAGEPLAAASLSLDMMLRLRISLLPEPARRLLEVIAVAGQPVSGSIAKAAAALGGGGQAAVAQLSAGRLVRTRRAEGQEEIETYHDRIRQAAAATLEPDAQLRCHYRLAVEWEASGRSDCRALAVHFHAAGVAEKTRRYALEAAEQAAAALAFDSAAHFYGLALEAEPSGAEEAQILRHKLGDALSNAGRGAEAAQAYLLAAAPMMGVKKVELQRRAATQFMISGRIEQGLGAVREMLRPLGMKLARWSWQAILTFAFWRIVTRIRGLRYRERAACEIDEQDLLRVDICFSMVQGLALVDPIRAYPFQAKGILLALRCGEPSRIVRALTLEAARSALAGARRRSQTQRLLNEAEMLASKGNRPFDAALISLGRGVAAFLEGEWKTAVERFSEAESIFHERCTGAFWDIALCHMMGSVSMLQMGRCKELSERLPRILSKAQTRGDLFEVTDLRIRLSHALFLAAGQPARAHEELDACLARWRRAAFDIQRWWALIARTEIDLYSGATLQAWKRLTDEWPALRWSFLPLVQYVSIESFQHRARAALASAENSALSRRERLRFIRKALRDTRRIERRNARWGNALAILLRAGIAALSREPALAVRLLTAAESALTASDMILYAMAARRSRGILIGGDVGGKLVTSADAWMEDQNIRNPERMVAMLAPGFRFL